jgi:Protein of unknown function (DUF2800)
MAKHAILGPSSAERWMTCAGSVALSEGLKDEGSEYADEGTAAHFLAAHCLVTGHEVSTQKGRFIYLMQSTATGEHYEAFGNAPNLYDDKQLNEFEVDDDMVEHVGKYVADVRGLVKGLEGATLHVEQRLSIAYMTGEEDAEGTSDTVIVSDTELIVADLKYGQGVRVDAKDNPQLKMYAASAVNKYGLMHDFEHVRVIINQPRLNHVSEHVYTLLEIREFEEEVAQAVKYVERAIEFYADKNDAFKKFLVPSEDACRWCKAKADCPELARFVKEAIDAEFTDISGVEDIAYYNSLKTEAYTDPDELSVKMKSIDLIEEWCKAVRAKVESVLLSGQPVPGYKLVEGKMGHRKWADEQEAEKVMKSMRLKVDEMYDMKLISPTSAEKVLKSKPKCWTRIKDQITQTRGGPSVAPESDKRPAMVITDVGDEMEDLTDLMG